MTEAEYLQAEAQLERPHEFWWGEMVKREGKERAHLTLTGNWLGLLNSPSKRARCHVGGSLLRVQIEPQIYVYPDIVLWRDDARWGPQEQDTLLTPLLIAEIFSPDTEIKDRREKLDAYRNLPSLRDYLMIAPGAVSVEHYARDENSDGWINHHYTRRAQTVRLAALDVEIEVGEFYRRLNVPEGLRSVAASED